MVQRLEVEAIPTGAWPSMPRWVSAACRAAVSSRIPGLESSGKTTLSLEILAEAQAIGGVVAFIDAEHALDPTYAARIGVDIDEVLISQPDTGRQARSRSLTCSCVPAPSMPSSSTPSPR